MPENRKFTRFKTTLYVRYSPLNSDREFCAIAKDISMAGIRLLLDKNLSLNADDFITLYLLIPQITIKVTGRVAWSAVKEDEKEIGVNFVNLADAHKEDIYNYIFKYYRQELTNKWWENM